MKLKDIGEAEVSTIWSTISDLVYGVLFFYGLIFVFVFGFIIYTFFTIQSERKQIMDKLDRPKRKRKRLF